MKYEVELSLQAERDIREIYSYILKNGPDYSDSWIDGLDKKLATLEIIPEGCGIAPESEFIQETIRQTIYTSYRLLFVIRKDKVFILTVRHSARKMMSIEQIKKI